MIEVVKNILYLASGVAIGYYVAHKRLENLYNERVDKADQDAKEFYRLKYEKQAREAGEDPQFTEAAIRAAEALRDYQGLDVGPEVLVQELTETFRREEEEAAEKEGEEDSEEDDDPEVEVEADPKSSILKVTIRDSTPVVRFPVPVIPEQSGPVDYNKISTPGVETTSTAEKEAAYSPEVIEGDAFINNVSGFDQYTVTYYSGDQILANEREEIISEEARLAILGDEVLQILNAGPEAMGGESTLYVMNSERNKEFEIIWHPRSYADEVGDPIYASG